MVLLVLAASVEAQKCEKGFLDLVDRSVPADVGNTDVIAALLKPEIARPQLSEAFDRTQAAAAVGDKLVLDRTKCPSSSSEEDGQGQLDCTFRNGDIGSIMRVKLDKGRIAYLNPARGYEAARGVENKVTRDQALKITNEVLGALGVPLAEIDMLNPEFRILKVAGQDSELKNPPEIHRAEVQIRLARHVGKTPVFDSEAKVAINGAAQVARLHIKWQDFHLPAGLASRQPLSRKAVVQQIDAELSRTHLCDSLSRLDAYIAYVQVQEVPVTERVDDDKAGVLGGDGFVPALVVYAVPVEPEEDSGKISMGGQQLTFPLLARAPRSQ
jgi:hypothetical protein